MKNTTCGKSWAGYVPSLKKNYLILTLLILFSSLQLGYATDYYFSTSLGNDSRSSTEAQNSTTPWRSIDKLNSISSILKGGDRIFFKAGEVFYGTIRITRSGSAGAPILFTSYGTGTRPIITSLVRVSNFVSIGNGLYQADLSSFNINKVQVVLINDQIKEIGRFPNSGSSDGGYLRIANVNSNTSIATQSGNPYSGSGGEVVIRKNNWIIDRHPIDYIGGTTINFRLNESHYGPQRNYGYFIQNHPSILDQSGEWSYDPISKRLTVNLNGFNAGTVNVSVATLDNLVINNASTTNLTFSNLHFRGSNSHLLNISRSENVKIENNVLDFAGENGISSYDIRGLVIENNQINYSLNSGIFMAHSTPAAIVRGNTITNTMPFQGMAKSSDLAGVGIYLASNGERSLIERNSLTNVGFNGIHFGGSYTKVVNNFIDNFCLFKQDGGGIYTNSDGLSTTNNVGREITGNIVLNGKGTRFGTLEDVDMAEGIYIDDNSAGVKVNKNTVAFMSGKSIYLHNANNIEITENLFYKSRSQVQFTHSTMGGPIRNVTVSQNQFSSIDKTDHVYSVYSVLDDIGSVGTFYSNYFLDPFNHDFFIRTRGSSDAQPGIDRNLSNWSTSFGFDTNALKPDLNLPTYNVTSSTLIKESNFSTNTSIIAGVYGATSQLVSSGISGNTLKINPNTSGNATAYIQIGAVQPGEKILVEFDMRGTPANIAIDLFLEGTFNMDKGTGNGKVSTTSSAVSHKVLLSSLTSKSNESIVLRIPARASEILLDNIKISKVTTQEIDKDSYIFFAYNPTGSPVQRGLNGTYINSKNQTFSGSVTVPSYGSVLLAKVSGETTPGTNQSPTISLTNPTNNQVFIKGVNPVELVANAQDPEGKIKQVEFYNWGNLMTTVTAPPYTFNWSAIQTGEYQVYAKVIDEGNLSASSSTVRFSVRDEAAGSPNYTAQMISPINNSTFELGSQEVILKTNASTSGLTISKIEFFNWGFPLVTVSTGNFEFNWSRIEPDTYNIYAKVTDNRGVVYTTTPIKFTVLAPNPNLAVNVSQPYNNQTFTLGQQLVKLKADVTSSSTVQSIQFFNWGIPVVTDTSAPYEFDWTRIEVGDYQIHAIVTSSDGRKETSNTVKFRVNSPTARITDSESSNTSSSLVKVEMAQPYDTQTFELGKDPVILDASVSEKVSKVEFFNWYNPLVSLDEGQNQFMWADVEVGDYLVFAKITDSMGQTSMSDPIRFKVIAPKPTSEENSTPTNEIELAKEEQIGSGYGIEMGPNPTTSHLNIFFDDYPADYEGIVSVFDLRGIEMFNSEFNTSQGTLTLDLA
ncbi:MAG TPA: Ig-like domain-containing protein, partial [Algoriphagus sp.]|nr:Ig-like domain-containing protein [Algoriphagus sp.]